LEGYFIPFIRRLACSEEWQRKYRVSLDSNIPFSVTFVGELDENLVNFLHYLEFYKRIYEIDKEERPKEIIIKNHILCDEWLRVYISNKDMERRKLKANSNTGSGRTERHKVTNFMS
jgi:hypothetical protein